MSRLTEIQTHQELIICPDCELIQRGTVEHTEPFYTYVHRCECGYIITESEWVEYPDLARAILTAKEEYIREYMSSHVDAPKSIPFRWIDDYVSKLVEK